jgi:hypothetical protein
VAKVCKIYRDLIENANDYHRDEDWPKLVLVDMRGQSELCCEQMRTILENTYEFRSTEEPVLGISWWHYDLQRVEEMKVCPFCSASIEYVPRKRLRYVEKMVSHWELEEVQTP